MNDQFQCPFCQTEISQESESCKACGREMPWMSHIYKRENSLYRGIVSFAEDFLNSIATGKKPNKNKFLGLINSLLIPRTYLILGSFFGSLLLCIEIYTLFQQNNIMKRQTILMESQDKWMSKQNLVSEFDQYAKIRQLLADTTYVKAKSTATGRVPVSSPHAIDFVVRLTEQDSVVYGPILEFLLNDANQTVRSGAFLCLKRMQTYLKKTDEFVIMNVDFGELGLTFNDEWSFNYLSISNCKLKRISFSEVEGNHIMIDGCDVTAISTNGSTIAALELRNNVVSHMSFRNSILPYFYSSGNNPKMSSDSFISVDWEATFVGRCLDSDIASMLNMKILQSKNRVNSYFKDKSSDYYVEQWKIDSVYYRSSSEVEQTRLLDSLKNKALEFGKYVNEKRRASGYKEFDVKRVMTAEF